MNIETVLAETVDAIQSLKAPHPLRIGIDGASASGKSTFANQLVEPLRKLGRTVIRASIDGFHNSPERSKLNRQIVCWHDSTIESIWMQSLT